MPITLAVLKEVDPVWQKHYDDWACCTRCAIGHHAHNHVFTRGTLPCQILFIGEGPGKTENLTGEPFVGKAGRTLDTWIDLLGERSWAITNLVLCRPCDAPGADNRPPTLEEIANCKERLNQFVRLIARPRAIITLGRFAKDHTPRFSCPTGHLPHPAHINYNGGPGSTKDLAAQATLTRFLRHI